MIHVTFDMFVDRAKVVAAIDKKRHKVLSQTGAYGMTVVRRKIRDPGKKERKDELVRLGQRTLVVPYFGKVYNIANRMPVDTATANRARVEAHRQRRSRRSRAKNQAPRRGPTDLLRRKIFFGIEVSTESVVIGPEPLPKQPRFSGGIVSVPQLLEEGGGEYFGSKLVKYNPHPYLKPSLPKVEKKFHELIEKVAL